MQYFCGTADHCANWRHRRRSRAHGVERYSAPLAPSMSHDLCATAILERSARRVIMQMYHHPNNEITTYYLRSNQRRKRRLY